MRSWRWALPAGAIFAVAHTLMPARLLAQPPAVAAKACACAQSEYRQFDFWIGDWTVSETTTGAPAGESRIERLYDGCGVRENWRDPELTGGSLNIYDRSDHLWHQFWIDSSGARREFIGGIEQGRMVLVSTHPSEKSPGVVIKERMMFTPNPDGSVRQYSDASRDGGVTWILRYDYTYRPKS